MRGLRDWMWSEALFQSKLVDGKDGTLPDHSKFRDYFDYAEPIRTVPSHRALAVFRGRTLELLDAKLVIEEKANPKCADGRTYARNTVNCEVGADGVAKCNGSQPGDTRSYHVQIGR